MNEFKKKLTSEITVWLQNELNSTNDSLIKDALGGISYKATDYFYHADSLRLRSAGYRLLKTYFDCEEFKHSRYFYTGEILTLSTHMNAPFFISENAIVLFSQENIIMCKMAGSVALWLDIFP